MSTDCENLLKKFLVLNPAKRASLESIMRDKWMNTGYEDDELRPYVEPQQDFKDHNRIGEDTIGILPTYYYVRLCSGIVGILRESSFMVT